MQFIKDFKDIGKDDVASVGGKGASLGELTQAGMPVPPGFVIVSGAFERFLAETDLTVEIDSTLRKVNHKEVRALESASAIIRSLILRAEIPEQIRKEMEDAFDALGEEFVAVRSSATLEDSVAAAWAGQLDSFLDTTKEGFLENVRKCWASLFTPRAIFYRFEKGMHAESISVAVVVQAMVQSEVSGVAFSVHPVTEDISQLIIEAGLGLGEAIVSGQITPDSFVVEKQSLRIIDVNIVDQKRKIVRTGAQGDGWVDVPGDQGKAQKLSDERIAELSRLILRIERHYGFPCDIEWAFAEGKFFIVQSRPITTLRAKRTEPAHAFEGRDMVFLGKRAANIHEAKLKVLAYSKVWESELGVGYKIGIMNSLGEYYVDADSAGKLEALFSSKDFAFAKIYMDKMSALKRELSKAVAADPSLDLTDKWSELMAYFFIVKSVFERIYAASTPDVQREIEKWRNDDTLFDPLETYYKLHPEEDEKSGFDWSWVFHDGKLEFRPENISFAKPESGNVEAEETEEDGRIIRGTPAYPGVIRGKVRLILSKEDKELVEEGEIIVAPMTTVDFLSIMKKAVAFVTDEGGITSHAAIIAREMKKPCIIGTKIASQTLKNGELIEVDANKGIVRILSGEPLAPQLDFYKI